MTIQRTLWIVFFTLVLSSASFILVLFRLNPYSAPYISLPLFFLSLFFLASGVFTFIGFFARIIARRKDEEFYNPINVSLRQALLLSLSICGLAGFQMLRTLTFWDGMLLILIIVFVELYFMAREKIM